MHERENARMSENWMIDELAYAGPEHLDEAFVAGFDRKQGYPDPAEDLATFEAHRLDETSSVVDLGAGTGTKASTLTSVLDRLERRGYVVREMDAADRRSFRLVLTESGSTVAARAREVIADLEQRALGGISSAQIAGFNAVITALREVS